MDGSHSPCCHCRSWLCTRPCLSSDYPLWGTRHNHIWSRALIYFKFVGCAVQMLSISHRQTTAYHPEANCAVERLHRHLKDTLCAWAAVATWTEVIPWVLLVLRSQPREDTGLSQAEAAYGGPLVLPNEFLHVEVDQTVSKFAKIIDTPAFSQPSKHNLGQQMQDELPADFLCASLFWVRCGGVIPPLQWPYHSPTRCCTMDRAPLPSKLGTGRSSSPPVVSSPARTTWLSQASQTVGADRPSPVRWLIWLPTFTEVPPPPSRSRFQTRWCPCLPRDTRFSWVYA